MLFYFETANKYAVWKENCVLLLLNSNNVYIVHQ